MFPTPPPAHTGIHIDSKGKERCTCNIRVTCESECRDRATITLVSTGCIRPAPVSCVPGRLCSAAQLADHVPDDLCRLPPPAVSGAPHLLVSKQLRPIPWSVTHRSIPLAPGSCRRSVPAPPADTRQVALGVHGSLRRHHELAEPPSHGRTQSTPLCSESTVTPDGPLVSAGAEGSGHTHELKSRESGVDGESGRPEPLRLFSVLRLQSQDRLHQQQSTESCEPKSSEQQQQCQQ